MQKHYDDLIVLLALTLVSYICLLIQGMNLLNLSSLVTYIPYILLLLFLPGYALLSAENPLFIQKGIPQRVGLAIIVSLILSILLALLLTYSPLKIFNDVMIYIIIIFTAILIFTAIIRRRRNHTVHFIDSEDEKASLELNHKKPYPKEVELEIEKVEEPENPEKQKENFKAELSTIKDRSTLIETATPEHDVNSSKIEPSESNATPKEESTINNKTPKEELPERKPTLKKRPSVSNTAEQTLPRPKKKPPTPKSSRRFVYYDLLLILALTAVSLAFLLVPGLNKTVLSSILGLFLMFFLPGYALVAVIYPRMEDLNGILRLVFSFGASYLLTAVIGLILNYIPLTLTISGDNLNSILLILSILTLILLTGAFLARRRVPNEKCFLIDFTGACRDVKSGLTGENRNRNLLSIAVFIAIILLVSTPAYEIMKPPEQTVSTYTEFYVLGPDGNNISEYPTNITSGENGTTTIVLVNHENAETSYRIVTTSNQTVMDEINITLQPNEKKEIPYNFTTGEPAVKKLDFLLYKLPNNNDVYLSQSFMITIVPAITETINEEIATDSTQNTDTSTDTTDTSQANQSEY